MISVASCSGLNTRKRKNPDTDGDARSSLPTKQYYVVLESESDICSSEEDTESVSSLQYKSTDIVKDTSDTCTKSSDQESLAGVEYEVVSLSEKEAEAPFSESPSDSDSHGWVKTRFGLVRMPTSSGTEADSNWADASEPECDGLPPPQPSRTCMKCKAKTNYRYCRQCFKVRKEYFPPRPKRQSRRKAYRKKSSMKDSKEPSQLPSSLDTISSVESTLAESTASEGLCNICLKNPKNAAFAHSQWVHVYSCYQCSIKTWFTNKRCPVCNQKVSQVYKVSIV